MCRIQKRFWQTTVGGVETLCRRPSNWLTMGFPAPSMPFQHPTETNWKLCMICQEDKGELHVHQNPKGKTWEVATVHWQKLRQFQ